MKNLVGKTFGKWQVIDVVSFGTNKPSKFLCRCECGREYTVVGTSLTSGKSTQCRVCASSNRNPYPQELRFVFKGMWQRCYDVNSSSYQRYGAKGTTICDEWLADRRLFYKWSVENGYRKGLVIDRINNNLGYSPSNCRWVTVAENNRNRGYCHYATINGKTQTVYEWCRELGLNAGTIYHRINKLGMSCEDALLTPKMRKP